MINIAACIFDTHDIKLTLVALAICCLGSFVVVSMFRKVYASDDAMVGSYWLPLMALVSGACVWATHFVAMLGFQPPMAVSYSAPTTIISFLIAVFLGGLAFSTLRLMQSFGGRILAGITLGLATVAMHYVGIGGMRVEAAIEWNVTLILLSVILSVVLSTAALLAAEGGKTRQQRFIGGLLFASSILALHFTGMSAMTLEPDPRVALPEGLLSGEKLAYLVALITLLIIGGGFTSWYVDQRSKRENEKRISFLARHDVLTSLPNRLHFEELVKRELSFAGQRACAVFCLDLDGFKEVNDIFGHPAGDQLLIQVADRLQSLLGERCIAARLGGDEFAILATGLGKTKTAALAAQSVVDAMNMPFSIDGNEINIGCSIGVALAPEDGNNYAALLSRADIALGRAKADGKGAFRFFEPAMDEMVRERRRIGNDLRQALQLGQLRLEYQPQVSIANDTVTGFEALLRWDHPSRGVVSPSQFIPIAEETGLILPIGEWAIREACREAAKWKDGLRVSVNLSVAQFRQSGLSRIIAEALQESGLPASRLEIEITESLFVDREPRAMMTLFSLKELGVSVAMDDFGTGYSSLATLQNFPFDTIKIDRSFVSQLGIGKKTTAIVNAILALGQELDIRVIAEGVETQAQWDLLSKRGCSEVQGFFCGKPQRIEHYSDVLSPVAPSRKRPQLRLA